VKIVCEKCGKEITGNAIKISVEEYEVIEDEKTGLGYKLSSMPGYSNEAWLCRECWRKLILWMRRKE